MVEQEKEVWEKVLERELSDYTLLNFDYRLYAFDENWKQILYDSSILNIDEVAKCICYLLKEKEGMDAIAVRTIICHNLEHQFVKRTLERPYCIIGSQDATDKLISEHKGNESYIYGKNLYEILYKKNIIAIKYPKKIKEILQYPKNDMVKWKPGENNNDLSIRMASGYAKLLNYEWGINMYNNIYNLYFDKEHEPYIENLIYSLAYHQYKNKIKYMSAEETQDTFQRIYKLKDN